MPLNMYIVATGLMHLQQATIEEGNWQKNADNRPHLLGSGRAPDVELHPNDGLTPQELIYNYAVAIYTLLFALACLFACMLPWSVRRLDASSLLVMLPSL